MCDVVYVTVTVQVGRRCCKS